MTEEEQQNAMRAIEHLLTKRGQKLGDLDKALHKSRGYFNRLKTTSDKYKLSYEMLKSVAGYLNVSLDYLTRDTFGGTRDNQRLSDFVERLYSQTVAGEIQWEEYSQMFIDKLISSGDIESIDAGPICREITEYLDPSDVDDYPKHLQNGLRERINMEFTDPDSLRGMPNLEWYGKDSLGFGKTINSVRYTEVEWPIDGYVYAKLNKIGSIIYLYKVRYWDAEHKENIQEVIEAYMVTEDCKMFICNSVEWSDYICSKLHDLYQLAHDVAAQLHLSDNTRMMIDMFIAD